MGVPGSNGRVYLYIGELKKLAFFKVERFQKIKSSMKNLKIFKLLLEILRFFENDFKNLSKISRKFRENLGNIHLSGFPRAVQNYFKKLSKKQWKPGIF